MVRNGGGFEQTFKAIDDMLWKEAGCTTELDYTEQSDLYDVLAYVAFALSPISRAERVETRKTGILSRYDDRRLQDFLDFVLGQYVSQGIEELDQEKLPHLLELKYHTVSDAMAALGGAGPIRAAFLGFQPHLFGTA